MVNSLIVQYLKQNKRLVIPSFGAFIKKDDTGEVIFVEFLKKDDGVLVSLIEQGYLLTHSEATEVVENYIINAKRQIFNTGNFVIESLGTMHIDANSVYNFEYNPDVKVEVVTKPAQPQQQQQSVTQHPQQSGRQSVQPQQQVEQERPKTEPEPKLETKQNDKPVPKFETVQPKDDKTIDVTGLRYQKPIKPVVFGHNKKKTDTIMLIAIIAAAIAILAMIYGMFSSKSPEITLDPVAPTQTEVTTTDTAK